MFSNQTNLLERKHGAQVVITHSPHKHVNPQLHVNSHFTTATEYNTTYRGHQKIQSNKMENFFHEFGVVNLRTENMSQREKSK